MIVALVTGGSGGIGYDIVLSLIKEGYHVAVTSRSMERLATVFKDVNSNLIHFIENDLMDPTTYPNIINSVVGRFGSIDLLVNNAGGGKLNETITSTTLEQWNEMMMLNLTSVYFLTQAALKYMQNNSCVITFSSVLGSRPVNGLGPYCIAKAGVEMLTKSLALEVAPRNIRVLCIAPAVIETNFHTNAGMTPEAAKKYYETSVNNHPIGRIGVPSDISELVLFLANNSKSGFMTGTVIPVDGGRLLTSASAGLK
jgi:NAD(P)-dependent dehydrogenase (short-subunit alcohol dehydrogenase family)